MRILLATDLAQAGTHDDAWHQSRVGCRALPSGEWVTSVGYAFAERPTPPAIDTLHVALLTPEPARNRPEAARAGRQLSLALSEGEVLVEIGQRRAVVGIDTAQWDACAAPILLAISVCWRFDAIEQTLDELTAWTRGQLRGTPGRTAGARSSALAHRARTLHALVVDLPCFEGSLDDPSGYFPSDSEARLYRRLARRLQLGARRARLDERVEILEGTFGALVDEHRHRQLLWWEIAVESLILLALLGDIGMHLALALLE
jgi:hypothetical protein